MSQGLQAVSWKLRRTNVYVAPLWVQRPKNLEGSFFEFQSRSQQVWDPSCCSRLSLKAGKASVPAHRQAEESFLPILLLYSGLQLIGWDVPTIERAICFTQSTDSNVNLIRKHPSRPTVKSVWLNMKVRQPMTLLRHESNHHITWHLS